MRQSIQTEATTFQMQHDTPLSYHFKHLHIWFDIAVLAALFVLASYFPILKIVPLIGSLELFSFFSFHLLAKRSRSQLQGFLGGVISSTAVFLQTLNDDRFSTRNVRELMLTLLFAVTAMLLECLLIIYVLAEDVPFIYYLPFIAQLLCIAIAILYIRNSTNPRFADQHAAMPATDIELLNDHPILWKNVAKLSALIFALVSIMNFIGNDLGLSREVSTLVVAFFEAHAILASVMTQWSMGAQNIELMSLFFLILLGSSLSKSYLVLKGDNLTQKWFFVAIMLGSLACSAALTFIWALLVS